MPIRDRLVHSLVVVTPTADADGDVDDYGQPVAGVPTETAVAGLIQPRKAEEVALISQAGAELSTHVVFLPSGTAIEAGSYIRFASGDGDRYEVTGVRDYDYGTANDHLEVDVRRVTSTALVGS